LLNPDPGGQNWSAVNYFQFLGIKTLDLELYPDPQLGKMLDFDPH
jgi:hypothetical protein